jgi:hypothetical protein
VRLKVVAASKIQWRVAIVGAQFHWAIAAMKHHRPSRGETALLQKPVAAKENQNQISQQPSLSNAPRTHRKLEHQPPRLKP